MPRTQMEDAPRWRLPKEELLPAHLESVTVRTVKYVKNGEDRQFDRWVWEWAVSEGEYAGLKARGESEDSLTNHPNNLVRPWAEAIRGCEFELGEGLDTDDLIGLPCLIEVDNTEETGKDGQIYYRTPVINVYPADALAGMEKPPF